MIFAKYPNQLIYLQFNLSKNKTIISSLMMENKSTVPQGKYTSYWATYFLQLLSNIAWNLRRKGESKQSQFQETH